MEQSNYFKGLILVLLALQFAELAASVLDEPHHEAETPGPQAVSCRRLQILAPYRVPVAFLTHAGLKEGVFGSLTLPFPKKEDTSSACRYD